jgi:hypothetical protein
MTYLAWQIRQHVYCGSVLRSDNFNTPIDCQHLAVRRQQGRGNTSNMAIMLTMRAWVLTRILSIGRYVQNHCEKKLVRLFKASNLLIPVHWL